MQAKIIVTTSEIMQFVTMSDIFRHILLKNWICLMFNMGRLHLHLEISQVALSSCIKGSRPVSRKLWYGDSGQDADNGNHYKEFNEGKSGPVAGHVNDLSQVLAQ